MINLYMNTITIETIVHAPIDKVWEYWNKPEHITQWAFASDDWHAPHAENNLIVGGNLTTTMAAKDNSMSFDFGGIYTNIIPNELIEYVMHKDPNEKSARKVSVSFFSADDKTTKIVETFDPEAQNPEEMQRAGWQAILDNFKHYVETH